MDNNAENYVENIVQTENGGVPEIVEAPPAEPKTEKAAHKMRWATAFAWVVALLAFFFCRSTPVAEKPFITFLFVLALYIAAAVWLIANKAKQTPLSLMFGISGILFSLSFFITDNEVIHACSLLWILCAYVYWLYLSTGNSIGSKDGILVLDFIKSFFVMPFTSLSSFFDVAFGTSASESANKRRGRIWKSIGFIALGLCIAIIPTIMVTALLSYDDRFSELLEKITNIPLESIGSYIVSLMFTVPLAIFGFSMLASFNARKMKNSMTAEGCGKFINGMKFAPTLMVLFAVIPLLLVYLLFFISQGEYYLAAFTGTLPEGTSFAEYARSGFFELCAVSGINAFVMLLVSMFTKLGKNGKTSISQRVASLFLSLSTLVLIATAISKMMLYINEYGLTQQRVYTTWFMIVLAIGFIFAIVKQIAPRFNFVVFFLAAFILLYSALALVNVDSFIVKNNADRYISGELVTFDASSMRRTLGDDAVPELIRVAEYIAEKENLNVEGCDISDAFDENKTMIYEFAAIVEKNNPGVDIDAYTLYAEIIGELDTWYSQFSKREMTPASLTLPTLRAQALVNQYK